MLLAIARPVDSFSISIQGIMTTIHTNRLDGGLSAADPSTDLSAIEGLNLTGILVRTGTNSWTLRSIAGPVAGISIADGDGVAGAPTLALVNDLAALEGLAATGIAVRSGDDSWVQRSIAAGTGISVSNGDGVAGNPSVAIDKAASANICTGTADKVLTSDNVVAALTPFALTDGANIVVPWTSFVKSEVTIAANRVVANPSGAPTHGMRHILVKGNDATPRAITFGSEYLGDVPTITDVTSTVWYMLDIEYIGTSHFHVTARKVKG